MVFSYSTVLENAGDSAVLRGQHLIAIRHYEFALRGCQYYASTATGSGEGMARMVDVNRVQAKLDKIGSRNDWSGFG
jgi:hypothetical protein